MVRVYTFLKLFEQLEHANTMLEGRLHMNTIEHFRNYRDTAGELRGDPYESVEGIYQPSQLSEIKIGAQVIPAKDLTAPVLIYPTHFGTWNVFCMYAVSNADLVDQVSWEMLADMKKALQLHEHCFGLGMHAVLLTNSQEFIARARSVERSWAFISN